MSLLWSLFTSFFFIGLLSFGGGYVAIPLIQNQIVYLNQWLTPQAFTDIITISQMTPGPIAINAATFVGLKVAGLAGSVVATLACILAPSLIVTLLAKFYFKYRSLKAMKDILTGVRPAVVGLIAAAACQIALLSLGSDIPRRWFLSINTMSQPNSFMGDIGRFLGLSGINLAVVVLFILLWVVSRRWKLKPAWVMILAGVAGALFFR